MGANMLTECQEQIPDTICVFLLSGLSCLEQEGDPHLTGHSQVGGRSPLVLLFFKLEAPEQEYREHGIDSRRRIVYDLL